MAQDGGTQAREASSGVTFGADRSKTAPHANELASDSPGNLSFEDEWRAEEIHRDIDRFYYDIPITLQALPEAQSQCLQYLLDAEQVLARRPLQLKDIIESRQAVAKVEIELNRASGGKAVSDSPRPLSREERQRAEDIRQDIHRLHEEVTTVLQALPDVQTLCLDNLLEAEQHLDSRPLQGINILASQRAVTRVDIELTRARSRRKSFVIVGVLVYIIAALVGVASAAGLFTITNAGVEELNQRLVVGVPLPVWVWSVVGSLTSMLLRAGQFPFLDFSEAIRWLLFRPVVGIVMGVLTYLIVVAGLLVFGGVRETQTPQLIWVIAFVGSFSDTLSINLLQGILGQFRRVESPVGVKKPEQEEDRNQTPSVTPR